VIAALGWHHAPELLEAVRRIGAVWSRQRLVRPVRRLERAAHGCTGSGTVACPHLISIFSVRLFDPLCNYLHNHNTILGF
jgi:hypothetical protein